MMLVDPLFVTRIVIVVVSPGKTQLWLRLAAGEATMTSLETASLEVTLLLVFRAFAS
ncbi:MAG: hypothetical protein ACYC9Y_10785 [Candidatus Methylomirabilia bacterium]